MAWQDNGWANALLALLLAAIVWFAVYVFMNNDAMRDRGGADLPDINVEVPAPDFAPAE